MSLLNDENLIGEIEIDAEISNVDVVTDFVNECLEKIECSMKVVTQFDVCIDEIFSNIAFYAYGGKKGKAIVKVYKETNPDKAVVTFIDNGKYYNPLEKEDPDISLSAEERQVGGLGIFIVKKSMDEILYDNIDNMNFFTIKKNI